jgi:hypothetical protein
MKNENERIELSCSPIEVIRTQSVAECQFWLVQTVILQVARWTLSYITQRWKSIWPFKYWKKEENSHNLKECTKKIQKNLSNSIINLARNPRKDLKKKYYISYSKFCCSVSYAMWRRVVWLRNSLNDPIVLNISKYIILEFDPNNF